MKVEVPVCEKLMLTIDEAAAYSNIGRDKLRALTDDKNCPFVFWNGNKRLIKRKALDRFVENGFSI